jgi:hypothetical protein
MPCARNTQLGLQLPSPKKVHTLKGHLLASCMLLSCQSTHATESNLDFKINLKSEIGIFNALEGEYTIDVGIYRTNSPEFGASTIGSIRINFGKWNSTVPQCLAKLTTSTKREQVKVAIYNAPLAATVKESMIDLDFLPGNTDPTRSTIKYRFQLDSAVLIKAYKIPPGGQPQQANEVNFKDYCHQMEIDIIRPNLTNPKKG